MSPSDAADYVRWIGGVCQLAGVVEVGYEVRATRRALDGPVDVAPVAFAKWLWRRVRPVLVRLHVAKPRTVAIRADAVLGWATLSGTATVTYGPEDDLSVEERLDRHLGRLVDHQQQLESLAAKLRDEGTDRDAAIAAEAALLRAEVEQVRALVREVSGSSLRLRWWAGVLIVVGIVCTTWPDGIASLVT